MKNLKIGTQLKLGFSAMLLFVILLGVVSYWHSGQIQLQTEMMYNHPLQTRNAIGKLEIGILEMRVGTRDLLNAINDKQRQDAVQQMERSAEDVVKQFNLLDKCYLGPDEDIDEARKAFIGWRVALSENTRLTLAGEIEKVKQRILSTGDVGIHREEMMAKIKKIDDFAYNKAVSLYASSLKFESSLNKQLILLVTAIILLSFFINYILLRNIRKPIVELTKAAKRFQNGDRNSRCSYKSQNELGQLAESFNRMVRDIQMNSELDEKVAGLSGLMLSEYDAKKFFQALLNAMALNTGSQMAAIYLLSGDKKTFDHFESVGVDDNARQSFASGSFEGEFGAAIASQKIQHLKNIPEDTRFVFHTVSGKFIPREMITIPVLANNEVVAVMSLVSISNYTKQSIRLIDNIYTALCARIEGILGYHKMKEFSQKLEYQNRELEAQKTELASQSAELTEQNAELEMQKNQLNESSRLKTSFLSNMSHELRTPLNSVIALSGVLSRRLDKKIPADEFSYLEVIERNGKHLLSLINDILDISRIEAGREEVEVSTFMVSNLIADVNGMIHPQANQKNIELYYAEGDNPIPVVSDFDKCRHILQNLVGNAVKFTETGKVVVSAHQTRNNITITVTDTGIGISEKHLPHIFDEFRQADGGTSRRFGGTGLGLAIAKKYANLLGGNISVISTLGEGSTFTLSLPMNYDTENTITSNEMRTHDPKFKVHPVTSYSGKKGKTILLVEDSEPAIIQMKDILEESGYHLLIARCGGEALELITHTIPDAMILDLMMPEIDGFEVLRTLREAESTAHIPVLILTAKHITKQELQFLTRNNIHQLIQKGDVNRNDLLLSVSKMIFPEAIETDVQQRNPPAIAGKPVILVVEDNRDNMITVRALLGNDYSMLESIDGRNGIEMARKHVPNLILMDMALPGIDGIEAFKVIRSDVKLQHIPVIALTASAMISDREAILAHGLDDYIAKPIDEKLFFKTINSVLYGK